jgi:hypothetical protein
MPGSGQRLQFPAPSNQRLRWYPVKESMRKAPGSRYRLRCACLAKIPHGCRAGLQSTRDHALM